MSYIAKFNPYAMDDHTILSVATGRKEILKNVMMTLKDNLTSESIAQHLLIRGPRGMGKSFFLKYLQIHFNKEEVFKDSEFILLPEEQTNLNTPADLLRLILNTINNEPAQQSAPMWEESDDAFNSELKKLNNYLDAKREKHPNYMMVVVLENLDTFIKNIESDKKKKKIHVSSFRHLLEKLSSFTFIGAVPQIDSDVDSDYNSRLFHAYKKCNLRPWKEEDYITYFKRRKAVVEKDPAKKIGEHESKILEAKLKAISLYTGGSPRIAVVLTNLLLEDDLVSTANTLNGLIDDLTPYYQDLTKSIPPKSKILFDALIRHGENLTQSELAEKVGAKQSQIAKAFSWLKENGYVIGKKRAEGAVYAYSIADRIHVLYHKQRELHNSQSYSSIWLLCDFLVSFYNPEEIKFHALKKLKEGVCKDSDDLAKVYFFSINFLDKEKLFDFEPSEGWERLIEGDEKINKLCSQINNLIEKSDDEENFDKLKQVIDELFLNYNVISDKHILINYLSEVLSFVNMFQKAKFHNSALYICYKFLDLIEKNNLNYLKANTFFLIGLNLDYLKKHSDASNYLLKSLEVKERNWNLLEKASILNMVGWNYERIEQYEKAILYFEKSNSISKQIVSTKLEASNHYHLGCVFEKIDKIESAFKSYEKSSNLYKSLGDLDFEAITLSKIGYILVEKEKYEEATEYFKKLVALNEQIGDVKGQANSLKELGSCMLKMGEYEKSNKYNHEACSHFHELGDEENEAMCCLMLSVNFMHLGATEKASNYFKKSFKLFPNDLERELREFLLGQYFIQAVNFDNWETIVSGILNKAVDKVSAFKNVGAAIKGLARRNGVDKCFEVGNRMLHLIPELLEERNVSDALSNMFSGLLKAEIDRNLFIDLCDEALIKFSKPEDQTVITASKLTLKYIDSGMSESFLEKVQPDMATAIKGIASQLK